MAEVIEQNTGKFNTPGTYKDPESGAESTVTHPAGADALVRLGWKLQEPKKSPVEDPKDSKK